METALALWRAPGERFRLLSQPLPPGLVHVLEVAAGAPIALQEAAADLGEPDHVVLEAARFYLEQMLFAAPEADAYRILGVRPKAPAEELRLHHRLLQRWLHPDRALAGDASVFATRVNQAWAQLRTPALRHDYDVMLAETRLAGADAPLPTAAFRHWADVDVAPLPGRRSRWLFAAALASCAVLAILIFRHEDDVDQPAWDASVAEAVPAQRAQIDGNEIAPLSQALASNPVGRPRRVVAAANDGSRAVASKFATAPTALPPREPRPMVPPQKALFAASPKATVVRQAQPMLPERADRTPAAPRASVTRVSAARLAPIGIAAAEAPPAAVHSAAAPAVQVPLVPRPSSPAVPRSSPPEAGPVMPVASASPPPQPPQASEGDPAVLLDRMHKAEQRVAQVTAYLAATPGAAPLWNDVRTQADADRLRQQLALRQGEGLQLMSPNWQLRPDNASFSGTYHCVRCGVREGRLEVKLVWREGLWLVRGVGLGPSA